MKLTKNIAGIALVCILALQSCTNVKRTMREPNVRVELERGDFEFSEQVNGEAKTTRILGIDWNRLTNKSKGAVVSDQGSIPIPIDIASIPVVGTVLFDATANYALWDMMSNNPGYDVVFYPQYITTVERPFLGLGFIYSKTEVKATARLAKIK